MHFVTSSYYRNELPKYVEKYNKKEWAIKLAKKDWKLELKDKEYGNSLPDENVHEPKLNKDGTSSFPYKLKKIVKERFRLLRNTPIGNQLYWIWLLNL